MEPSAIRQQIADRERFAPDPQAIRNAVTAAHNTPPEARRWRRAVMLASAAAVVVLLAITVGTAGSLHPSTPPPFTAVAVSPTLSLPSTTTATPSAATALQETDHLSSALVHRSPSPAGGTAVIQGQLVASGVSARSVPGQITIHQGSPDGPVAVTVDTDSAGRFKVTLPPGTYALTGTSPEIKGGRLLCRGSPAVAASPDTAVVANVFCDIF